LLCLIPGIFQGQNFGSLGIPMSSLLPSQRHGNKPKQHANDHP
jgi:hypothetical protein